MIIQLNLVGPIMQITKTIGGEVQRQASNRLHEHFSEPVLAQPHAVRTRSVNDSFDEDSTDDELRRRRAVLM